LKSAEERRALNTFKDEDNVYSNAFEHDAKSSDFNPPPAQRISTFIWQGRCLSNPYVLICLSKINP
jgi:hypothetical protein